MYVLSLLIALCLSLHGLQTTATKPPSSKKHDAEKAENKKPDQTKSTLQGIGTNHEPSQITVAATQQQYDPYSDRLYRAYLWATVAGVFGGLVGIGFLIAQTIATKTAANAAKTSAEAALRSAQATVNSERPWMFIEIKTTALVTGETKAEEPPVSIIFRVNFHNHGSTPAEVVSFDQHIDCRKSTDDLPSPPKYSLEGHVLAHTRMIPPGQSFEPPGEPSFIPSRIFVAEQWKDIRNSQRRLIYWGRIQYRDLIEDAKTIHEIEKTATIHDTCFCYFWSPALNEFLICGPLGYNKHT